MLALLIAAAVAAYAWDRANANEIANGIRVDGVPIGGLSDADAKRKLRAELIQPLEQPITVVLDGKQYVLGPKHLNVQANLSAMLAAAHDASRQGSLPTRLWRYATGEDVSDNLPARVNYSHNGVNDFIDVVAQQVDQAPTDASVQPGPASINLVSGHDGIALDKSKLRSELNDEIGSSDTRRVVHAPVYRTKPAVSTDELAAKYPTYLTVDRTNFQIRLWKNLKLAKTYPIAVGMQGLETPAGTYTINDKQVNPSWHVPNDAWAGDLAGKVIPPGPEDPIKARWNGAGNADHRARLPAGSVQLPVDGSGGDGAVLVLIQPSVRRSEPAARAKRLRAPAAMDSHEARGDQHDRRRDRQSRALSAPGDRGIGARHCRG